MPSNPTPSNMKLVLEQPGAREIKVKLILAGGQVAMIVVTREVSYVYYFNREPKGFAGGELRVFDDQIRNNKLAIAESFRMFEPRNNSIIFFHSAVMHEVTRVDVASKDFRDSRFTVNGWIHRA
jgi:Rps23 Pro-64 3,4-dihydroxylase Tpa1-like proline 4-hydroxylase